MAVSDDLLLIQEQERVLQFRTFSMTDAWQLGCRLHANALAQNWPVVIDVRRFDAPLFYVALDGSTPDNAQWARRKSNVVARFHRSSYAMGLSLAQRNATLEDRYGLPTIDYAAHGGSFPLAVQNVGIIGSVTLSGLPQRDDHSAVVAALCQVLGVDEVGLRLASED